MGPRIEKTGGILKFLSNLSTTFKMARNRPRIAYSASEGFRLGQNLPKLAIFGLFFVFFKLALYNLKKI